MKNKRLLMLVGSVCLALMLAVPVVAGCAGPAPTPEEAITIKYDAYHPPTNRTSIAHKWYFDRLIEEAAKLGYTIEVEYYWAQALSRTGTQLQSVRDGRAEAGMVATGYVPSLLPLCQGLDQTYVTIREDAWIMAAQEVYDTHQPLRYEWEVRNGAKLINFLSGGNVQMFCNEPYYNIDAIKGKKIRAYGVTGQTLELLGAVPVSLPFSEAYTAAERGVVDAIYGANFGGGGTYKLYEPCPIVLDTGAGHFGSGALVFNLDFYNSLPQEVKDIMVNLRSEYPQYTTELTMSDNAKAVEIFHKAGAKFLIWSDEEVAKAKAIVQPAQVKIWADRVAPLGFQGMDMFNVLVDAVKKYEPQSTWVTALEMWRERYPEDEMKP